MAFSTPMLKYLKNPPGPIRNYPLPPLFLLSEKMAMTSSITLPVNDREFTPGYRVNKHTDLIHIFVRENVLNC